MLPYTTASDAEAALRRTLTRAEAAWFRYTAAKPDYYLYYHTVAVLLAVYTLLPLMLALLELGAPAVALRFKLQPRGARLSPSGFLRCYTDTARFLLPLAAPVQLLSYPAVKMLGIRMGLPLPSAGQMAAQLLMYLLVEDYLSYWVHRLMHTKWCYDKIHHVHHEYTAPNGFVAPYMHWTEVLILTVPTVVGPVIAPCHLITFGIWFVMVAISAIETHCGYNFPFNPTKLIPFWGGAEFHDYHHYLGGNCQSNFATVFTYCDYLYGTDNAFRRHKARQAKLKMVAEKNVEK
ncbi:very-long-chain aldehyde decarbonylase GL1-10-like [Triticum dicoccoides]|uniref:very-long-chain aldehyde decarbonylase GL1-10-like n=1 Tax=Triticum dicoccoides TaxID=85692 RepID=UPI00188FCF78|nr:very-long-chain aldehyde decarbonylase GL1-10-like [Triticum dicoccoides]